MKIKRFIGGNLESNGYIIYQNNGGECYIIDPGYNPENFLRFLKKENLKLKGILLTHHHYDHVGGVARIHGDTSAPVCLHRGDLGMYKGNVDTVLEDGDVLDLDGEAVNVISTPGHTEGGVCYYSEKSKLAFTGDTIFNVDLGRTDLKDGSEKAMRHSIADIISSWSNEITIYPGHGDSCTMKYVRKNNREYLDITGE